MVEQPARSKVDAPRIKGSEMGPAPKKRRRAKPTPIVAPPVRIGLALGGGFARGIAHIGVMKVLEEEHIPLHCIAGVSAGSIVAAAWASGRPAAEIAAVASHMRLYDFAFFSLCRLGLMHTERMNAFLHKLLKVYRFEEMQVPLGIVATDLKSGEAMLFCKHGDVTTPIRASCSFPGLFQPVAFQGQLLTDGAIAMEVPAAAARHMGANHVLSISLPYEDLTEPTNVAGVVNRCFQILQLRTEDSWRKHSDLVVTPPVDHIGWNGFQHASQLVAAGEAAARAALPQLREWLGTTAMPPAVDGLSIAS
ncbi:MAG TPA: hypothetical protein DEQ47_05535 [Solibacterales bacterium]|nr:hypothetical protein [Bryobacterales bacterium]